MNITLEEILEFLNIKYDEPNTGKWSILERVYERIEITEAFPQFITVEADNTTIKTFFVKL